TCLAIFEKSNSMLSSSVNLVGSTPRTNISSTRFGARLTLLFKRCFKTGTRAATCGHSIPSLRTISRQQGTSHRRQKVCSWTTGSRQTSSLWMPCRRWINFPTCAPFHVFRKLI
ncbi:unnamed protein product, partial [Aphanomyces euteiches]